jgi:hypothetical protein
MSDTGTIDGLSRNPTSEHDKVGRSPNDADSDGGPLRTSRRLPDKILIAFHHACDQGDFEVARGLLGVLELIITRLAVLPEARERRSEHSLVAAYERLWALTHPMSTQ